MTHAVSDAESENALACFRRALGAVGGPLIALASNDRIEYISEAFAKTFGVEACDLEGRSAHSCLEISRIRPYSKTEIPGLDGPEYVAKLSAAGSVGVVFGLICRRVWLTGRRMLVVTLVPLSGLLQREKQHVALKENLELKVRMRTLALASRVRELDLARAKLAAALRELRQTQENLVESEKMAALGDLVAGVAHEVNTPLGVGVTASSHLGEILAALRQAYETDSITREDLEEFLSDCDEAAQILDKNLRRASELIRSFKQVAVDHTSEDIRPFKAHEYLDEILLSLRPRLKKTPHQIHLSCPDDLTVNCSPGALAQIVTNLVMNSLLHAFDAETDVPGDIWLDLHTVDQSQLHLQYRDNGSGIPASLKAKIFEPFVTTKRARGGTGLGLHIIHNVVTQKLKGSIECASESGEGVCFDIKWPVEQMADTPGQKQAVGLAGNSEG